MPNGYRVARRINRRVSFRPSRGAQYRRAPIRQQSLLRPRNPVTVRAGNRRSLVPRFR